MRIILAVITSLLAAIIAPSYAEPEQPESKVERPVLRTILALYHSGEESAAGETRLHKFVEMPFNHLGYTLTYWDLKRGLPPPALTAKAAAVATWFGDEIPGSAAYLDWAQKAAKRGLRFVIFESPGAPGRPGELPAINALLAHLGLVRRDGYVSDTAAVQTTTVDKGLVGFERPLFRPLLPFSPFEAAAPAAGTPVPTVHLAAAVPGRPQPAVLVATGPGGGYVASGYAIHYDQARKRLAWLIDPIAFLANALAQPLMPIPDTTTLDGRRIYFSHIDGDGWNNPTHIERHRTPEGQPLASAEVVLNELVVPFPDLPVTIGLISCDIDPALKGRTEGAGIARRLYALPQVEAASHTHTHPFDWRFYESYTRAKELARINPPPPPRPVTPATSAFGWPWESAPKRLPAPAPVAAIPAGPPPRANTQVPFDLSGEVKGSLGIVQSLLPEGKRPELYLWSGDTRPFEGAVRATRSAQVRNMNGGDSRLDKDYPSLAYVPPTGRAIGKERQIYAVNSNENTYTNEWKGPFDGFAKLSETLDRTDMPRRLKPMNVYYHMYSGERAPALAAVKAHLERARTSGVIPIPASQYAAIADSFYDVELTATGPRSWRVTNRGALQTVRFDGAAGLTLDLAASDGVLGETSHAGSLYVALDPATEAPEVVLKPRTDDVPARPSLVESRWQVSWLDAQPCDVEGQATGFGPAEMTWAGLAPGRTYKIEVLSASTDIPPIVQDGLLAGPDGRLSFSVAADGRAGAAVRITCSTGKTPNSATE